MAAPTPKITYQIQAVSGSASSIYLWKITNLLTGEIKYYPVNNCTLTLKLGSGTATSSTDYSFVWHRDELNPTCINIIDVRYIGNSGTPNYGNPSTDLASILALI